MHKYTKLVVIPLLEAVTFDTGLDIPAPHATINNLFRGYERRPPFRYNYQRDKFLAQRDEFICINRDIKGIAVLIRRKHHTDDLTLFKSSGVAESVLEELAEALRNNGYSVNIEEVCEETRLDISTGRHENHIGVMDATI